MCYWIAESVWKIILSKNPEEMYIVERLIEQTHSDFKNNKFSSVLTWRPKDVANERHGICPFQWQNCIFPREI